MSNTFRNHSNQNSIKYHHILPIIEASTFDFFRCVEIGDWCYNRTVDKMHRGNLRLGKTTNRYAKLFPFMYVSYWADSIDTARCELYYHHGSVNFALFEAFDVEISKRSSMNQSTLLRIVDGREINFHRILEKDEQGIPLTASERELIYTISDENPDCLAYPSKRHPDGMNFLFFKNGFNKLMLRSVSLHYLDPPRIDRIICEEAEESMESCFLNFERQMFFQ